VAEHTDQSTAPLDEKLRRYLRHIADPKSHVHFHYDGFPRPSLASEALAFLADMEAGRLNVTCGVATGHGGQDASA
jgi:hypothetical protein